MESEGSNWAKRGPRWGFGVAITLAGVALGSGAQALTVNEPIVSGRSKDDAREDAYKYYVSKADCLNPAVTFSFTVTGQSDDGNVDVWRSEGTNCALKTERDRTDTTDKCVSLATGLISGKLEVSAKKMIEGLPDVKADDCTDTRKSDAARPILIFFVDKGRTGMLTGAVDAGVTTNGADFDTLLWTKSPVDLIPPDPPAGIKISSGDELLILKFNKPAGSDPEKYSFFCALQPAGSDGQTCSLPNANPGTLPDHHGECGDFTASPGEQTTVLQKLKSGQALVNDTFVAVAVASVDEANNVGPLSDIVCAAPVPTKDFFEAYKEAGGKAGGGFGLCSAGGDSRLGLPLAAGATLALAALGGRRWRRRAERRRSSGAR